MQAMAQVSALQSIIQGLKQVPLPLWILLLVSLVIISGAAFYTFVFIVAPTPRPTLRSETKFITVARDGAQTGPQTLPCWLAKTSPVNSMGTKDDAVSYSSTIDEAELHMSLVVPAFNEELRLTTMLEEAAEYLEAQYGSGMPDTKQDSLRQRANAKDESNGAAPTSRQKRSGSKRDWEILVVSDGSTDATVPTALEFAKRYPGDRIRVIKLEQNRGKGGAVVHGMRHVRGSYVIFADADGASRFSDLGKMVEACEQAQDKLGRAVAVGSRAHLVGSEAVVKRSKLRNFLMHSFHLLLRLLTPPATSRVKDTQCGFKLFSRASLPFIVPHMHSEGWIFDVEMLMLAERAYIPMVEVHIGWHEVKGSKLNVVWDSLGMAWGLFILRAAWAVGVYRL